ncbi:Leucine-rich repeat transmembrane protein kinase [Prunus dulcis]|uniref:non-specific serine/threonine protein kinase n=1 Tax=Prunus dulcis TaxID=3755 RepID=A0A4Y1QUM5_PRUDU|nr:Leucine-rich repeat transmembrane protein kinase [Prunus dulcis]
MVSALNKIIDHWDLGNQLSLTIDPCMPNATWASNTANPRVLCDCAGSTCHITHLKIYALDILGEIPRELFELKELIDFSLGINNLTGPVPPEIGNLSKLLSLSFGSNQFSGPLPMELGKLTTLQELYLDSSGVTGPIPQELANLKSLKTLWASDNLFTGKLPEFLGIFAELKDLRLEGTLLEGPIPSNFGALVKLDILRVGDLGEEDSSLGFLENLTSLSTLSLRNCRVSGKIPEQIGNFAKLQYLYLGDNNLSGELPANIVTPKLIALDVSFNPMSGNLPLNFARTGFSMNVLGTSINGNGLPDRKSIVAASFSIKCGGTGQTSASGIEYDDDSETLGAASFYKSSRWAVSSTGNFVFNSNGPRYIASTDSQITETLESELYKTARLSPSSLRYFGLDLMNGKYIVELHFAEIAMEDDTSSWKGLGRRIFDVYIQGERVLQDFNIQKEAGGSKRALIKTFETNVSNTIMNIHFMWAGKGTCCIPLQGTYGPLVSAINVRQVPGAGNSANRGRKRVRRIVGISLGCAAAVMIVSSVFYLWWIKDDAAGHMRVQTDIPKK